MLPTEDYREIRLTNGELTKVDPADFEWLSQWTWCAYWHPRTRSFYAVRFPQKGVGRTTMHKLILDPPSGYEADHWNHDTLDNRRKNLRYATSSQQAQNRRRRSDNTSGYKGVTWFKKNQKWGVQIFVNKRNVFIGLFTDKELAARKYDEAALKYFGEFVDTNLQK